MFTSGCAGGSFLQEYIFQELSQFLPLYDQDYILQMVRKLEKLDFKLRKTKLDITFLCKCENNDIIPNFLFLNN